MIDIASFLALYLPPMQKIINDPVYGFITINQPLIFNIIAHPYFQRLRRINQMALAFLVYPGAVHTRLHHALGAYHLMGNAINELKLKGIEITEEEELSAKAAILLHDIGHGPFSHALEGQLVVSVHHEAISLYMMQALNEEFGGKLSMAIDIFTNKYPKKFLHQLVSGQVDVDRMDYLTRDSFYTGVSEGVIGYDRIIKMLAVQNGELMVEEKGIFSIEKFLVARRQMYWQVYLHKTVLSAEMMLVNILKRARTFVEKKDISIKTGGAIDFFLFDFKGEMNGIMLDKFCKLDDTDCTFALKMWSNHPDFVLSELSKRLLNRQLLKIKIQAEPFENELVENKLLEASTILNIDKSDAAYFVFTGEADNTMYKTSDEKINILFKDGSVKDITSIDNPLIQQTSSAPIKKFYVCSLS